MISQKYQNEIDHYIANTPKSRALQEKAAQFLPGGSTRGAAFYDPYPVFIDKGQGNYLYDVDGNKYLDFVINATSLILGHANPLIVNALQDQALKGTAYSAPAESQIRLAKLLCDRIPSVDTIRFTNSGTEATLNAMRAARAFTGRHKVAKFEGLYHGTHEYVEVSVHPPSDALNENETISILEFPGQSPSLVDDVIVLPFNNLEESSRIIRQHHKELACVIMEAVVSEFGYIPANIEFLKGIRDLTTELGILLIFDEVQSFRVAPGGAQEMFGVIPDLTALGKIVGGGMPAGAFGGREDVMALYGSPGKKPVIPHAGTFNGNPMTMVAGEVVMNQLTPHVYERLNRLGEILRRKLRAIFDELEMPVQITGVASFFGINITDNEITNYRSKLLRNQELNDLLFIGLVNEGVMIQSSGDGALSTLTTEAEIDEFADAVRRVIQRIR